MTATAETKIATKTSFITDGYYCIGSEKKIVTLDEIKKWGKFLRGFGHEVSFRGVYDERTELPEYYIALLEVLRSHRPSISIDGVVTDWLDISSEQYVGIAGAMLKKMKDDGARSNSVLGWRFDGEYKSELEALFFVCDYMPNDDIPKNKRILKMMEENGENGDLIHFHSNHVWTKPEKDEIVDFTSDEIAKGKTIWEKSRVGFLKWNTLEVYRSDFNEETKKNEKHLMFASCTRLDANEKLEEKKLKDEGLAWDKAIDRYYALAEETFENTRLFVDLSEGRLNGKTDELSKIKKKIARLRRLYNQVFSEKKEEEYEQSMDEFEELVDAAMKNRVKEKTVEIDWGTLVLQIIIIAIYATIGIAIATY